MFGVCSAVVETAIWSFAMGNIMSPKYSTATDGDVFLYLCDFQKCTSTPTDVHHCIYLCTVMFVGIFVFADCGMHGCDNPQDIGEEIPCTNQRDMLSTSRADSDVGDWSAPYDNPEEMFDSHDATNAAGHYTGYAQPLPCDAARDKDSKI